METREGAGTLRGDGSMKKESACESEPDALYQELIPFLLERLRTENGYDVKDSIATRVLAAALALNGMLMAPMHFLEETEPYNDTSPSDLEQESAQDSDNLDSDDLRHLFYIGSGNMGENPIRKTVHRCSTCMYWTHKKSDLKRHQLTHTQEKRFACELCSYRAAQRSNLKVHQYKHTQEKNYTCEECSYKTAYKGCLKRHAFVHSPDQSFACGSCSYTSSQRHDVKQHEFMHKQSEGIQCSRCPYIASGRSDMKTHRLSHIGENYFCHFCPYQSPRNSDVKRHMFTHSQERKFQCDLCPYKATRQVYLKRHQTARHMSSVSKDKN